MDIRFLAQPVTAQIGSELTGLLTDPGLREVRFLVAWGKNSGLRRIRLALETALSAGVDVEIVVGVDEGGATIEGLQALLEMSSRAFVFHNPGRPKRTFHPKVYHLTADDHVSVIIGSGNLTSGGLFGNYEAATLIRATTGDVAGEDFADRVLDYYSTIREDPNSTRLLTAELIEELKNHPTIIVKNERSRRHAKSAIADASTSASSLFLESVEPLMGIPPVATSPSAAGEEPADEDDDDGIAIVDHQDELDDAEADADAGALPPRPSDPTSPGFYKRLSKNDVSLTSSPGQIIIPKQFLGFFGELEDQGSRQTVVGPEQFGRDDIPTVYHDGAVTRELSGRLITYDPGPNQPRPNTDVRFTLRDHAALESLSEGDYLDFEWRAGALHVTRSSTPRPKKWEWR